MTLPEIHFWRDPSFRSAARQMALDEALFHWSAGTGLAAARFYHWETPALTVGYFHRTEPGDPPLPDGTVRRYTGGGLVEHGTDLTFVLTLPAGGDAARATGIERYRWIHQALADALGDAGFPVALEPSRRSREQGPCFSHPVAWDLRDPGTGKKIGGGAQRRSRGAVIHQGSVRLPDTFRDPLAGWISDFLQRLGETPVALDEPARAALSQDAAERERERYGSADWNQGGEASRNSSGKRV